MNLDLKIRKAEISDAEAVKDIEIECGLAPWSVVDYRKEVEHENSVFYVGEVKREVVGFIMARLITIRNPHLYLSDVNFQAKKHTEIYDSNNSNLESECSSTNEVEIYSIGVRKNLRRLGIGKTLLTKLFKIAGPRKVQKFWLEVRQSNSEAYSFYTSNGFEFTQQRRNFYSNPVENGLIMCLSTRKEKKT